MDQARPAQAEESNGFGDWDIRKEQNVRPKVEENTFENVEKKEFDTFSRDEVRSNDDDELSTPPFFRRKR
ncbi:cell division protein FtsZ, partial [Listeria monocytogenes]|jgi:cell division protein FtsZ|nr:cell division protein FtsZ [Listeria monocytogenes]